MTRDEHDLLQDELPLPSPRSPGELDDKILSYSRSMAPTQQPWLQRHWAAGLATAGVLVLALFITVPKQPVPGVGPLPDRALEETSFSSAAKRSKAAPAAVRELRMLQERDEAAVAEDAAEPLPAKSPILQAEMMASDTMPAARAKQAAAGLALPAEREGILHRCIELMQAGDTEQARALYGELRTQCPECALPDTLEQAISQFDKTGSAPLSK